MALTRVSRHIIDEPLELQNINATGIGTFASLRVTGDLQVDGTTTTLDTVVTEVDRLEVLANNTTVAVAVTQSGSGDAAIFMGGNFGIGTNNPAYALDVKQTDTTNPLTIAAKGGTDGGGYYWESNSGTTYGAVGYGKLITANSGSTNSAITTWGSQDLLLGTNRVERLRVTSSGNLGIGLTNPSVKLVVSNGGTSSSASGGTLARIVGSGVARLDIVGGNSNHSILEFSRANLTAAGQITYTHSDNSLSFTANGAQEKLRITSDGKVRVPDNGKFVAGDGDDLQIYHDGSHSFIKDVGTGNLYIGADQNILLTNPAANEFYASFNNNGAVELYYDNSKKFETTNTGVTVTGDITPTGYIQIDDSSSGGNLYIGDSSDLKLFHNGTNSYIRSGASNAPILFDNNSGVLGAKFIPAGAFELYHNGSKKFETTSTGVKLPDNEKLKFGTSDDLWIYHDGGNSWVRDVGTGTLYIDSNGSGVIFSKNTAAEKTAAFYTDGAVELYYDNSKKLETTTTGAKVTGALEVTQEYPSIRPTLDLNFAATKTLDRRITFTRDSVGTYTDDMGIVKYASNNVPRFDHDPTTGESLGLLIEESGTNLFTYSENFDSWGTAYRTTISLNVAISPSGQLNASKFNVTTDTGYHARSFSITGGTYTVSIFAKAGEYDGIQITGSNTDQDHACFNLVNGTAYHSGTNVTNIKIQNYGNGWYRCSARLPLTNGNLFVAITDGTTTSWLPSFAGSSATDGIYIWGAQIEAGSFATSYIPTSGSTVTRDDDDAVIKGTNFSDIYNETEGTIFSEFSTKVNTGTTSKWAVSLRDPANNNNYIAVKTYSSNMQVLTVQSGGSTVANLSVNNSVVVDQFRRIAASFKLNDFDAADGGTLLTGDTSGAMPTSITQMDIGRGWTNSDQKLEGHIKSIKYYRTKLPDAQLQGLTQQ